MQLRTGQRNNASGHAGPAKPVVTTYLTEFLKYKLWSGLLVRTADHGVDSDYVPATFWRWDIHVPNQMFIVDDHMTVHYESAVFGYVVDPEMLDWKHETLYPHDANACDSPSTPQSPSGAGRCTFMQWGDYWDCPGAVAGDCGLGATQLASLAGNKLLAEALETFCKVVGAPRVVIDSKLMKGAGNHKCRGCHFKQGGTGFRRLLPGGAGKLDGGDNTVGLPWDHSEYQGRNCQCKCATPKACEDLAARLVKQHLPDETDPIDHKMCWTDKPDLLVAMQNGLWESWKKKDPKQASNQKYWGWSEVAAPKRINEPQYHAANLIYLTPQLTNGNNGPQGLDALTPAIGKDLDSQIQEAAKGTDPKVGPTVKVGSAFRGQHPGSDVVIARQNYAKEEGKFYFEFFCQEYTGATYKICAKEKTTTDPGYCYLEYAQKGCQ